MPRHSASTAASSTLAIASTSNFPKETLDERTGAQGRLHQVVRWSVSVFTTRRSTESVRELLVTQLHTLPYRENVLCGGIVDNRVAPTFVLKYNIRTRSLADPGAIEDVLAVENDVVPFDRADVLGAGLRPGFPW